MPLMNEQKTHIGEHHI